MVYVRIRHPQCHNKHSHNKEKRVDSNHVTFKQHLFANYHYFKDYLKKMMQHGNIATIFLPINNLDLFCNENLYEIF